MSATSLIQEYSLMSATSLVQGYSKLIEKLTYLLECICEDHSFLEQVCGTDVSDGAIYYKGLTALEVKFLDEGRKGSLKKLGYKLYALERYISDMGRAFEESEKVFTQIDDKYK
jgi:hypothetical protein